MLIFGVINNHYFMRSDYDEIKKEFITPYNFVGGYKQSGYRDDVGTEARMNNPCQGVFVEKIRIILVKKSMISIL